VPELSTDTSVPAPPTLVGADRRVHPRLTANDLRGLVTARVKYGAEVRLIDLSVGGALVESQGKFSRDANIVFEFAGPSSTLLVPSRALRVSSLSHMDDSGRYEGAFAFKRPLALTELLKEPASAWQKIVARCRDGRILQGYTNDFQATKRGLTISPTPFTAASRDVSLSDLDSIFFMRDSAMGQADGKQAAQTLGRRVAVTLPDGEVVVGTTLNYRRDGAGFFVQPASSPNMLRVFVTQWAIRNLVFL
jgi:uncharacterized protein DUF6982